LAVTVSSGVGEKNVAAIDEAYGTRLDAQRDLLELANLSRLAQTSCRRGSGEGSVGLA